MRTFNIYSLNSFQVYCTCLYSKDVFYMWTFILLDYLHLCCPSPHPNSGNNQSFCVCVCVNFIYKWDHMIFALFDFYLHRSIHVAANDANLFFFMVEYYPTVCVCITFSLFIHQWTFWLLLYFHYCKNNAAMNMEIKISFQVNVFVFFG